MSAGGDIFRTFCHISEYGADGYENLHRMVAASSPVVLWAPSSKLIESAACRLTNREYVKLVEDGQIRIIGREDWILSRPFRNNHRWSGSRWVSEIDDAIKSIALDDQSAPLSERRVALADRERGDVWAAEYIANNPHIVNDVSRQLLAADAVRNFPEGVVEYASAVRDDPIQMVMRIVRDAYNHDAAIAQSGTLTPFLLSPRESRFQELLGTIRAASDVDFPQVALGDQYSLSEISELTLEVISVLRSLERARLTSVVAFVNSGGHRLLADWMRRLCDSLIRTSAEDFRGEIIARLQDEFNSGQLDNDWRSIFGGSEAIVGTIGTVSGVADSVTSGSLTVLGSVGLAAGAYSISHGLAKRFGYAAVDYSGPQWAFLYSFGRKASGRRHRKLRTTLDLLGS